MKEQERQASARSLVGVRRGRFVKAPFVPGAGPGTAPWHSLAGLPAALGTLSLQPPAGPGSRAAQHQLCVRQRPPSRGLTPLRGRLQRYLAKEDVPLIMHTHNTNSPLGQGPEPLVLPPKQTACTRSASQTLWLSRTTIHSGHKIGFRTRYCRHFAPCAHTVLRAAPGAAATFGNHCTTELKSHPSSMCCPFDEQISHALNSLSLTWLALQSP